ncbi:serine hydrolase [Nocardioides insulae]|uniref:serine hydrolase n=1 Tax=Nocardioides insulae TaxID=394734 RepID=UPI001469A092|nr:serine hydrolase [Nocardioides insulae]
MGESVVSTWASGLDGVPLEARNVNQQHAAAGLVALPAAVAAFRQGGVEDDLRALIGRALPGASAQAAAELVARVGPAAVAEVLAEARCSVMTEVAETPGDSLISAHDAGRILIALAEGRLTDPEDAAELERLMREHDERDGLPLGLPADVTVANVIGGSDGVRHDIALVRSGERPPTVICLLTSGLDEDEAEVRVGELARYLWDTLPR